MLHRTLLPALAATTLALLATSAGAAHAAGDFDTLLEAVPSKAHVVVGVDHRAMRKHVHYEGLFKLLNAQGYGRVLAVLAKAGVEPGKDITHAVSFRFFKTKEASVLKGNASAAKLRKFAQGALAKAFKEGTHGDRKWFLLADQLAAADLGKGRLLVGPLALVKAGIDALGKQDTVRKRDKFVALHKEASEGDAVVWSVSFIPKQVRETLQKQGAGDMAHVTESTLRISGSADLSLRMIGHTGNKKGAAEVAGALNGKIERKVLGNRVLNALVGGLVRQLSIKAKGTKVTGKMALTADQVAVVAKYGSRVIKLLR